VLSSCENSSCDVISEFVVDASWVSALLSFFGCCDVAAPSLLSRFRLVLRVVLTILSNDRSYRLRRINTVRLCTDM